MVDSTLGSPDGPSEPLMMKYVNSNSNDTLLVALGTFLNVFDDNCSSDTMGGKSRFEGNLL